MIDYVCIAKSLGTFILFLLMTEECLPLEIESTPDDEKTLRRMELTKTMSPAQLAEIRSIKVGIDR